MASTSLGNALPAKSTTSELEHVLQLRYLDSPSERATLTILRELGVHIDQLPSSHEGNSEVPLTSARNPLPQDSPLCVEHTSQESASYIVYEGRIWLDLRDSGNCWIRCCLEKGMQVTLAPHLFRRFVLRPANLGMSSFGSQKQAAAAASAPNAILSECARGLQNSVAALTPRYVKPSDALEVVAYHTYRTLVCDLCRQFYDAGWVTGTGGSISIRYGNRIYMTPSGVQKERIEPDELYVLDIDGAILDAPQQKPGARKPPKLSDCSPLFLHAFRLRNAGAVLHSHGYSCNLVTCLMDGAKEFRITHQEMIKGLAGYGYQDDLVIPIIENTSFEYELAESLSRAIQAYPKASAVLVRRHGIYVWGDSWEAAKRHAECLHYLFEMAIEMRKLQLNFEVPPVTAGSSEGQECNGSSRKRLRASSAPENGKCSSMAESHRVVLLDIEGTTTPITFVKDVLFPYARDHVKTFLERTWTNAATQADVEALRAQAENDVQNGMQGVPRILPDNEGDQGTVIQSVVAYVHWNIQADRKITALKQLQGHIWQEGYDSGELKAQVYDDVPVFMRRMQQAGVRVAIYSSGSREAQRLLFKHSDQGDLRQYLSVYFDTKVGHKRQAASYREILQSLGVDSAREVLFVTDVIEEAQAASGAGLDAVLSIRPGNAPLPASHPFPTVTSFANL